MRWESGEKAMTRPGPMHVLDVRLRLRDVCLSSTVDYADIPSRFCRIKACNGSQVAHTLRAGAGELVLVEGGELARTWNWCFVSHTVPLLLRRSLPRFSPTLHPSHDVEHLRRCRSPCRGSVLRQKDAQDAPKF